MSHKHYRLRPSEISRNLNRTLGKLADNLPMIMQHEERFCEDCGRSFNPAFEFHTLCPACKHKRNLWFLARAA